MASLFSKDEEAAILKTATNSKSISKTMSASKKQSSINSELQEISKNVIAYFPDSPAILINTEEQLHEYVTALIASGYAGIDTETTGLDRYYDHIVGASLYYPGGVEAYIPSRHMVPIFNTPYKNQLTYEQIAKEFRRIADSNVRLLFANADFDLSMIYKDIGVDFCDNFYYDVILAWRCLKENELHNGLKELYNKYVLKGSGDPKKFTDFFSPELFPYCDPEVAKLYAANDAKITYDLFRWQLPYTQKDHPKCKKSHLEAISDLIWNVEFPLVKSCQHMHRRGISLDKDIAKIIGKKYHSQYDKELEKVKSMVQDIIDSATVVRGTKAKPFTRGEDFNPTSPLHVKYLLYTLMNLPEPKKGGTGKDALADINLPITKQIVKVRSLSTLIGTFVDKMPEATTPDGKIHAQFKQIGAGTGRMSSANPNMQNIPSHADDIRHMFRSTPEVVQDIDCHLNNGIIDVEVNHFDFVKVDGEFVEVSKLNEESIVTVLVNKGEVRCKLVEPIHLLPNSCRVSLKLAAVYTNIFDGQAVTITVKTPPYVLLSSDYSAQEPRITAHVSNDPILIDNFVHNRDPYATIASISFGVPYEKCLEFHPETHEYQPDGKARRGEAKFILLGICYGRSVPSIAEQLYGTRDDMTDEEKTKKAQYVYDSVLNNFPGLRNAMISSQAFARKHGYVETILGRRRHLPDMQLPEFEFKAMPGYVNPDIDPLDISTLSNKSQIPERIVAKLTKEFAEYKYFGQIAKRTKELYEQKIRVINNRKKIGDATRQVLNSIIQGSAADQTKMAILKIDNDPDWARIGGHILIPVHDEIIAEVPIQYAEEGGKILSKCMVDAASFLPFPSKCDVETMINWYSLSYPCPYTRPTKLTNLTEDEVRWVQYYLYCAGYELPIIPNDDGSDLKGDAAKGVNGKTSPEYYSLLEEYMKYYRISEDEFIDHIEKRVISGIDSLMRN